MTCICRYDVQYVQLLEGVQAHATGFSSGPLESFAYTWSGRDTILRGLINHSCVCPSWLCHGSVLQCFLESCSGRKNMSGKTMSIFDIVSHRHLILRYLLLSPNSHLCSWAFLICCLCRLWSVVATCDIAGFGC
jgi:hypothetical protein